MKTEHSNQPVAGDSSIQMLCICFERLEEADDFVPGRLVENEAYNQNNGNGKNSHEDDNSSNEQRPAGVLHLYLNKLYGVYIWYVHVCECMVCVKCLLSINM